MGGGFHFKNKNITIFTENNEEKYMVIGMEKIVDFEEIK